MLIQRLGQIIAHTCRSAIRNSIRGIHNCGACWHQDLGYRAVVSEEEVLPGGKPPSKFSTFWQTVKPFGWQGLLLTAVLIFLYAPVLKLLVWQWYNDADYSHGFLVPVVVGVPDLGPAGQAPPDSARAVGLGNGHRAVLAGRAVSRQPGRGALAGALVVHRLHLRPDRLLRGLRRCCARMAFPIAFLLFAIPMPVVVYNEIVFPLQFIASKFATRTLEILEPLPHHARRQCADPARHAAGGSGSVQRHPFAHVVAGPGCRVRIRC